MRRRKRSAATAHGNFGRWTVAWRNAPSHAAVRLIAALMCILASRVALAGLSPENVIVVVNADSAASRTIANHYVNLRQIPTPNVILLRDVPSGLKVSLEDFKDKILLPVLNQIERRRLGAQARVIAYSAAFPTSVDISAHSARLTDPSLKRHQRPTASINGLTYLYQFLLADSELYLGWASNLYARGSFERHFVNPFLQGELKQQFESAVGLSEQEKYDQAADLFERLFEQAPTFSPLAILAAENRARADDSEAAGQLIMQAVTSGWTSGRYLRESTLLGPLISDPQLAGLASRLTDLPIDVQEPLGFAATVGWTNNGQPFTDPNKGVRYMLSCSLAVVHNRGSDVDQAVRVLNRAALADQTHPDAKFWFTRTKDVRSTTRFPAIGDAIAWLSHLGRDAEIVHSVMPNTRGQCVGLMLGTATMPLEKRRWSFVPGAIAENLTSLSAAFGTGSQTKITELLHAGAAISSGPVAEPYSIPHKFPAPMMYGYYASGVTAIEAFYLSVSSPYQLLIVGDPLAQPYARPPSDWVVTSLQSTTDGQRQIRVSRRAFATPNGPPPTIGMEVYVDGRLWQRLPSTSGIHLNLSNDLSGAAEVTTVLIGEELVRPRVSHRHWVHFESDYATPTATPLDDGMTVKLVCDGAEWIELAHFGQTIGKVRGSSGTIQLDREQLGDGPLRIRPVARVGDKKTLGRETVIPTVQP